MHSEVNGSFSGAAGAALGPGSSQSRCELGKDAFARLRVGALALFGELQTTGRESYHLSCRSLVLLGTRLRAQSQIGAIPDLRYAALRRAASPPFETTPEQIQVGR